jgi:hypothetical protein
MKDEIKGGNAFFIIFYTLHVNLQRRDTGRNAPNFSKVKHFRIFFAKILKLDTYFTLPKLKGGDPSMTLYGRN